MDSLSISSISGEARENSINKKFLLSRKPARQPNPIIHRKLRRGSAAARFADKQFEYPTNKELLRTIAYLRNATSPNKILPHNKSFIIDDEDEEEWLTQSEEEHNSKLHHQNGQLQLETSIQKPKKKNSLVDKANKECGIFSSSSHVVNIRDTCKTSEHGQQLTKNDLHKSASICEAFIQFCSAEIICPQEHRAALAVKLYGVQVAMLSALGNPFENLTQSISSINGSHSKLLVLSLGQASAGFLAAMIWTGMFIVTFVYTVMVVWSLAFRVAIISMLCLALLYCLSMLVAAASGFSVMCGTFRMSGILFASLGVLGFVLLFLVLLMLLLFASWRNTKQVGGSK
ncbi:hypothetical protein VNO77_21144 [Canavalia gladiata]|uniref:Transmembrane protein n=1 Tax=Canavalia gladiata TaxID=3824 RepID=A0AAN9QM13_CANGL